MNGMVRAVSRCFALLAVAITTSCVRVDFEQALPSRFEGVLHVMWLDATSETERGRFIYFPDPQRPLRFIRELPEGQMVLQPEVMYTDGGSIPRAATLFNGFSPWGYAPAYIIHDWLFVAANCITDGQERPAEQVVRQLTFEDSALVIYEAIRALQQSNRVIQDDFSREVISRAVTSRISQNAWDAVGRCGERRVLPEDLRRLDLRIPIIRTEVIEGRSVETIVGERVVANPNLIVTSFEF